jgi:hypothetical protein
MVQALVFHHRVVIINLTIRLMATFLRGVACHSWLPCLSMRACVVSLWIHVPFAYRLGCIFLPHPRRLHPIMLSSGPLFQIISSLSPLVRLLLPSLVHSPHPASHLALPLIPLLALETASGILPIHFSHSRSAAKITMRTELYHTTKLIPDSAL